MLFEVISPDGEVVAEVNCDSDNEVYEMTIFPGKKDYPWEMECLLKRGITRPDSDIVKLYLRCRVYPQDRQNIGEILQDMGLDHYTIDGQLKVMQGRNMFDDFTMRVKEK